MPIPKKQEEQMVVEDNDGEDGDDEGDNDDDDNAMEEVDKPEAKAEEDPPKTKRHRVESGYLCDYNGPGPRKGFCFHLKALPDSQGCTNGPTGRPSSHRSSH